jgi:hypothetical protein
MTEGRQPERESVVREIGRAFGRGLVNEGRRWLRWAGTGAVVGAVLLGPAGGYFFGLEGLGIGLLAGAVIGGVGSLLLYFILSAESSLF